MISHIHGGDIYSYNNDILDFSVNINPLATPQKVIEAGIKAFNEVKNYPDVYCRNLRTAIASSINCKSDNIICGNGAAELIFNISYAMRPKRVLLIVPGFAEYERAARAIDAQIIYYTLKKENGFVIKDDILNFLDYDIDMIFICNPNNPTGVCTDRDMLHSILNKCKQCGITAVIDECFLDFVCSGEQYSVISCLDKFKNVIVLKSFTKLYAMPGIRFGYAACGNLSIINAIYNVRQPWSVSNIAQQMGVAALKETNFIEETRRYIKTERDYLYGELKRVKPLISQANYILFKADRGLDKRLIDKNILIRNCSNYYGLEEGYFRIAIKKHTENLSLIKALSEVI